jgi:hypothetical protein
MVQLVTLTWCVKTFPNQFVHQLCVNHTHTTHVYTYNVKVNEYQIILSKKVQQNQK